MPPLESITSPHEGGCILLSYRQAIGDKGSPLCLRRGSLCLLGGRVIGDN